MPSRATDPLPVRWHPSPNFGARRGGLVPDLVVLHYTAMATMEAALARLCDPAFEVSAHYLIGANGDTVQMVREDDRAWHAGAGAWRGRGDVNSRSIGIELDNDGRSPFPERQMVALERLLGDIMARRAIAPAGLIGHSDMAPGRKIDPGARFDWRRLALQGLAIWPGASAGAADGDRLHDDLCAAGYPADVDPDTVLAAFRLRFRPWAHGPADATDRALAHAVARMAVDPARATA
ncbi:N-acetylmuramoyl-L-alanine amidase [Oceaniglobus indicus]|uniref:N-acetylmuramoyl-L-alanine amidase n=1 Tax=Oceaniglobus indicus TaxID=2047749 RepID=UPI001F4E7B86|nr:N-acetylmuramoyl-L-alanine amidase [Oceaniglobus indicus]